MKNYTQNEYIDAMIKGLAEENTNTKASSLKMPECGCGVHELKIEISKGFGERIGLNPHAKT